MQDKKFKTKEELLDFVLTECGDMKYWCDDTDSIKDQDPMSDFWNTSYIFKLEIEDNLNIERVFYAYELLKRYFDIEIESLRIQDEISEIDEGWLYKIQLKKLVLPDSLTRLPKLPNTIEYIFYPKIGDIEISREWDNQGKETYTLTIYKESRLKLKGWKDFHHERSPLGIYYGRDYIKKSFKYENKEELLKDLQNEEFRP